MNNVHLDFFHFYPTPKLHYKKKTYASSRVFVGLNNMHKQFLRLKHFKHKLIALLNN